MRLYHWKPSASVIFPSMGIPVRFFVWHSAFRVNSVTISPEFKTGLLTIPSASFTALLSPSSNSSKWSDKVQALYNKLSSVDRAHSAGSEIVSSDDFGTWADIALWSVKSSQSGHPSPSCPVLSLPPKGGNSLLQIHRPFPSIHIPSGLTSQNGN